MSIWTLISKVGEWFADATVTDEEAAVLRSERIVRASGGLERAAESARLVRLRQALGEPSRPTVEQLRQMPIGRLVPKPADPRKMTGRLTVGDQVTKYNEGEAHPLGEDRHMTDREIQQKLVGEAIGILGKDLAERVLRPAHEIDRLAATLDQELCDRYEGAKPIGGLDPTAITIGYTNWRGEHSVRTIIPIMMWFGSTPWHKDQWLIKAHDLDKGERRDFALLGFSR